MQIVQESPIIQELRQGWLEEGREKGREEGREKGHKEGHKEGREEGERKAKIESLGQILVIRFGIALGEFDKHFEELDLKPLKELTEVALTVDSLTKFEDELTNMLPKNEES